ncbi:MAG: hypothetical protein GY939_02985 [Actinomycetia bacterium]|nr:hypothetical protein [Actinomycetes bacterium]
MSKLLEVGADWWKLMRSSHGEERGPAAKRALEVGVEPKVSRSILISGPDEIAAPSCPSDPGPEGDPTAIWFDDELNSSVRLESDPGLHAAVYASEPGPESVWADLGHEPGRGYPNVGLWDETIPAHVPLPVPPLAMDEPTMVVEHQSAPGGTLLLEERGNGSVDAHARSYGGHRGERDQSAVVRQVVLLAVCLVLALAVIAVVAPGGFRLASGGESNGADLVPGSVAKQGDLDVRGTSSVSTPRRLGAGAQGDGGLEPEPTETSQEPVPSSSATTETTVSTSSTTLDPTTSSTSGSTTTTPSTTPTTDPGSSTSSSTDTSTSSTTETTTTTLSTTTSSTATSSTSTSSTSTSSSSTTTSESTTTTTTS